MKPILSIFVAGIVILCSFGCSGEPAQATAEQEKNFKGGPPPPDLAEKIAAAKQAGMNAGQAAQQKAQGGAAGH